jgi:hypothetical protein
VTFLHHDLLVAEHTLCRSHAGATFYGFWSIPGGACATACAGSITYAAILLKTKDEINVMQNSGKYFN